MKRAFSFTEDQLEELKRKRSRAASFLRPKTQQHVKHQKEEAQCQKQKEEEQEQRLQKKAEQRQKQRAEQRLQQKAEQLQKQKEEQLQKQKEEQRQKQKEEQRQKQRRQHQKLNKLIKDQPKKQQIQEVQVQQEQEQQVQEQQVQEQQVQEQQVQQEQEQQVQEQQVQEQQVQVQQEQEQQVQQEQEQQVQQEQEQQVQQEQEQEQAEQEQEQVQQEQEQEEQVQQEQVQVQEEQQERVDELSLQQIPPSLNQPCIPFVQLPPALDTEETLVIETSVIPVHEEQVRSLTEEPLEQLGVRDWICTELKRGSELMVCQLAQDFVLDRIIAPMLNADLSHKRHLPVDLWHGFTPVPGLAYFRELSNVSVDVNLVQEFGSVFPDFVPKDLSRLIHTDEGRRLFMSFVFWFVTTVFITKEVQFYWESDIGFGIKSGQALARTSMLQGCWGHKVELSISDVQNLKDVGSCTLIVKFVDKLRSVRCFAVFGPLGFVQQSCRICSNVTLFPGPPKTRVDPLINDVTEDVLTLCYSLTDLRIGEELFFCLKPSPCMSPRHAAIHTAPLISF